MSASSSGKARRRPAGPVGLRIGKQQQGTSYEPPGQDSTTLTLVLPAVVISL